MLPIINTARFCAYVADLRESDKDVACYALVVRNAPANLRFGELVSIIRVSSESVHLRICQESLEGVEIEWGGSAEQKGFFCHQIMSCFMAKNDMFVLLEDSPDSSLRLLASDFLEGNIP